LRYQLSTPTLTLMGLFKVFDVIGGRLDRLEATLEAVEIRGTPGSSQDEIVALRASQDATTALVDGLATQIKQITLATAEGIERVDRAERRIQATVKRARRHLAESGYVDDGLETEAGDLRLLDGGGSESEPVPSVPTEVAASAPEASSIPGVTREQLLRVRFM